MDLHYLKAEKKTVANLPCLDEMEIPAIYFMSYKPGCSLKDVAGLAIPTYGTKHTSSLHAKI